MHTAACVSFQKSDVLVGAPLLLGSLNSESMSGDLMGKTQKGLMSSDPGTETWSFPTSQPENLRKLRFCLRVYESNLGHRASGASPPPK